MDWSCVQESFLCGLTAMVVGVADCRAQLTASLFPYAQGKQPSWSLRYSTENTMDRGGKTLLAVQVLFTLYHTSLKFTVGSFQNKSNN